MKKQKEVAAFRITQDVVIRKQNKNDLNQFVVKQNISASMALERSSKNKASKVKDRSSSAQTVTSFSSTKAVCNFPQKGGSFPRVAPEKRLLPPTNSFPRAAPEKKSSKASVKVGSSAQTVTSFSSAKAVHKFPQKGNSLPRAAPDKRSFASTTSFSRASVRVGSSAQTVTSFSSTKAVHNFPQGRNSFPRAAPQKRSLASASSFSSASIW